MNAPRPARVLLLAALLVAAAIGLYAGSRLLETEELSVLPAPTIAPAPPPEPATATLDLAGEVVDLAIAPDGTAWAATGRGVLRWDEVDRSATLYGVADGLPDAGVTRVVAGPDGVVWASGYTWLARFDGSWILLDGPEALGGPVETYLGGMAVDVHGRLWVAAAASSGENKLLRFDGDLTVIDVPESVVGPGEGWANQLSVTASGTVFVSPSEGGLAVFDGAAWTRHSKGTSGLPGMPSQTAPGADGTVWAELAGEGCELTISGSVACEVPPAGLGRLDGTTWRVYTMADGLASNDAYPYAGLDGSVWAVHPDGAASRWDGTRWTASLEAGMVVRPAVTVAPDGALWSWSPGGIVRFDGLRATRVAVPPASIAVAQPVLTLSRVGGPEVTETHLGEVTWQVFGAPDHALVDMRATAHGLVAVDGRSGLRWSTDGESWQGISLSIPAARFLAIDGDDVIAYGSGAVRASWNGRQWVEVAKLEIDGGRYAEQIVVGPRRAVMTSRTGVLFSADGRRFELAAWGPDHGRLEALLTDADGYVGGCGPNVRWGSGEGRVGPVLVTADGFVALTAGHPADWNNDPMCEPVLWSSPDGSSWELVSKESPFGPLAYVTAVASLDGQYVAVGGRQGSGAVWISDDGRAWTRLDISLAEVWAVAAGPAGWALIEEHGSGWMSSDGLAWERLQGWPGARTGWWPPTLAVGPATIVTLGYLKPAETGDWTWAVVLGTVRD